MKRHAALADLARDHFHALSCAQRIRKAQTGPEKLAAAGALVKLWNEDLIHHFREEEEVLLPLLSRHGSPTDHPDVRRMLDDHAFLRDGLRRLEAGLLAAEDCRELAELLGARLEEHARLEDRIIFGHLEQCLSEVELAELGRLSQQFRARWARPTGPMKAACPPASGHPTRPVATHFILFVKQQAASRDFYQAILSLEPRLDVPGMTEFELGRGTVLGLMPKDSLQALLGLESGHHSSELYLVVPDPKAKAARALERGASVASPLAKRSWGAEVIYLRDPDGHILALADREV
jgi:predicted enzyme related to lactoylglutathione lyase